MDNGFDYSNISTEPKESKPVLQPESVPQPEPNAYTAQPAPAAPVTPAPAPKAERKRGGKALVIVTSIVAAVMLLFNLVMLATNADLKTSLENQTNQNAALGDRVEDLENALKGNESTVIIPSNPGQAAPQEGLYTPQQVYAMNVDAVVAVSSQGIQTNIYGQISRTASAGSGFIISDDGYVVTNYHVIEGASKVSIITANETEHDAVVVGYDETNDVALLKMEGHFDYVTLGSSDELQVGDQVMAIGNPLGELTSTLTVGYVSAKDRMVSTDGSTINMLQTDAAINSGNSGGPLFNAKGEVIGINTAKYSGTTTSGATIEGIGFAIPIDDVVGVIYDLQDKGYVSSTYLGVMVKEVPSEAQAYGLPAGVYVDEVTPGYCAEEAGVQREDIIIALGEYEVNSFSSLSRALRRFKAGDETTITVYRSGKELTLDIVLDEKPQQTSATVPEEETQPEEEQSQRDYSDIWDYFFGNG